MVSTEKKAGFRFLIAGPEHTEIIKKMYESISYDGPIDIQFRRGDDPYHSVVSESDDHVILLCRSERDGKYIAMGICSIYKAYLDGEIKRVGYLNGLKILPEYRKKMTILPRGFAALHEVLDGRVDLCFASMLRSAAENQKMFEKRRSFMPAYVRQCEYTSYLFRPARRDGIGLCHGFSEKLNEFYKLNAPKYNLRPVHPVSEITDNDWLYWEKDGRIAAACAVFDETENKNYYLNRYNGVMRTLSHFPTKLIGLPAFPKEHSIADTVTMSMLLFDDSLDLPERRRFILSASSYARDHNICILGLTDSGDTYKVFRSIPNVPFGSYLYTIDWGRDSDITGRRVFCDTALM